MNAKAILRDVDEAISGLDKQNLTALASDMDSMNTSAGELKTATGTGAGNAKAVLGALGVSAAALKASTGLGDGNAKTAIGNVDTRTDAVISAFNVLKTPASNLKTQTATALAAYTTRKTESNAVKANALALKQYLEENILP